jgi:hypothetical protein
MHRRQLRTTSRCLASVIAALLPLTWADTLEASTIYRVELNTAEFVGTPRRLAFDWVATAAPSNIAKVARFVTDGRRGQSLFQGGPVSGGLLDGVGALAATLRDSAFLSQLVVPLDSTGLSVTFDVGTSENAPVGQAEPNQFSFYFLNPDDSYAFPTVDRFGTNCLFAIDVSGQIGGDLFVFAPMEFVPPDTLRMTSSTTDVRSQPPLGQRLRFAGAFPNPFSGPVRLAYEVPPPGGHVRLRVFDLAGRLVARPFDGERLPGPSVVMWNGRGDSGRLVAPGIYLVQLQMSGQSAVRRIVLTR